MIQLRLCDCGTETIYARGMGALCYRKWWIANTEAPERHGVRSTYAVRGCRCDTCSAAEQAYKAAYKARKREASA